MGSVYLKKVFVKNFFSRVIVVQHLRVKGCTLFGRIAEVYGLAIVIEVHVGGKPLVIWSKEGTLMNH